MEFPRLTLVLVPFALVIALPVRAQHTPIVHDTTCRACENFYKFANDPSTTEKLSGSLHQLGSVAAAAHREDTQVANIVRAAAADVQQSKTRLPVNSDRYKLGTYYLACVDTSRIKQVGIHPAEPYLRRIVSATSIRDLMRAAGDVKRDFGGGFLAVGTSADARDARQNITVIAYFSGLGLPSQNFYLQDDGRFPAIRRSYEEHIAATFRLIGESPDSALLHASMVVRLETELARRQPSSQVAREPRWRDFGVTPAELDTIVPHIPWRAYLDGAGAPPVSRINARYPTALRALDSLFVSVPLSDWKELFQWELLSSAAPYLSRDFVREREGIAALTATPDPHATRTGRCAEEARSALPDAVSSEYVRENFSPAARSQAQAMTEKVISVLRERIRALTWMSDSTKGGAFMKLDSLVRDVGYPKAWRTYSSLSFAPGEYFQNHVELNRQQYKTTWQQLTMQNDRAAWRNSPAAGRAVYIAAANQMDATAAFLQAAGFVAGGDVATNYGAAGAVIGHELTHVFDVTGGRFDASGNIRDWWTKNDAAQYAKLVQPLVTQFNHYAIDSTHTVNGQSTLGENISDLGGLQIAYIAMERSLTPAQRRPIGGFTAEQRFFLAYARLLRQVETGDMALDAASATHSPPQWRVNGPLSNLPEFARAWSCKPGDPMVRSDADRISIW